MAIQKITSGIIADGAIVATDVADGSITTAKIADGNVTSAKIDTVANTKITGLVTSGQIANVANTQVTGSIEATQVGTTVSQLFGMRNRIINGAMEIDQRNAGAEKNPAVNDTYYVDRWAVASGAASKFKIQQDAGAVTPPTGFNDYLGCTSLSAYTAGASEQFGIYQPIEGYNVADLAFGTASAKTITISFWVRSSLTGTFGGSVRNSAANRSYVFSYTISAANTWEQKSVTITGDTSGTWLVTNGVGMYVFFSIGSGSTVSGTAGSWAAANYVSATGATSVVGTNAATFYITGVQLEVGSTATPFERRLYNQELANCCRYYWQQVSAVAGTRGLGVGSYLTSAYLEWFVQFPVQMRAAPTIVSATVVGGYEIYRNSTTDTFDVVLLGTSTTNSAFAYNNLQISGTAGQAGSVYSNNASASVAFTAEL